MAVRVSANATVRHDGAVEVAVKCDGREAIIVFGAHDISVDLPEQVVQGNASLAAGPAA